MKNQIRVRHYLNQGLTQITSYEERPRKSQRPSFIYFIQAADDPTGPVKIGVSKRPKHRLAQLQIGSPYDLRLLGTYPGDDLTEAFLHRVFSGDHLRGEWFRYSERLAQVAAGAFMMTLDGRIVPDPSFTSEPLK